MHKKLITLTITLAFSLALFVPQAFAVMYTEAWYNLITKPIPYQPDLVISNIYLDDEGRLTIQQSNTGISDIATPYGGETHVYIDNILKYVYDWDFLDDKGFLKAESSSEFRISPYTDVHMVMVCADKGGYAGFGVVNEASEQNNCMTRRIDSRSPDPVTRRTGYKRPTSKTPATNVRMPRYRRIRGF
ncbi:hypothetical protein HOG48_02855 [Candidatus Peregrinibacteria bacterium]|jgi:hypothetical protein|nr:hypothetical protein [Candidatus Peregrinibacteria bacterium]